MKIKVSSQLLNKLSAKEIFFERPPGFSLPEKSIFERPCNLKRSHCEYQVYVGAFSYAVSAYLFGVKIGRYCSIGEGVQIGRHSHPLHFGSTSPLFYNQNQAVFGNHYKDKTFKPFNLHEHPTPFKETTIGNDVYIGHEALLMPGIKVGNGAVIGARAVVTKDVPDYAVVAGAPATVRKYRFDKDLILSMMSSKWWEYSLEQLNQVTPNDPFSFVQAVKCLRDNRVPTYQPDLIYLQNFQ